MMPQRIRARPPLRPAQEARIIFNPTPERQIGIGEDGTVYTGRLHFGNQHRVRVAIKRFHAPLTKQQIMLYPRVIARLEAEGVQIPRQQLVQLPSGEWVLVSQLFGSNTRSKTGSNFPSNARAIRQAIVESTKVANAGYPPDEEVMDNLRYPKRGIIPIDLHTLVDGPQRETTHEIAKKLIRYMMDLEYGRQKQRELVKVMLKIAKPRLRREILRIRPTG